VRTADVLDLARELADVADGLTLAAFRRDPAVMVKGDGTVVTAVDVAVEAALRERILSEFPDHRVLGEEAGWGTGDADRDADGDGADATPVWTLDPIDGTTNFVKGNPIFATLIACSAGGRDLVGVVSAPALGSRWAGVVGEGATQDGRPVRVSTTTRLADAEVSVGAFSDIEDRTPGLLAHLASTTTRQRGYGDFWAYCLLAAGSTDAVIEARLNAWDLAAVRAVVEAAGGRVTDLDGVPRSDGGSAVASNGALHDELLAAIAEHRRV
jgi:histidinol-phosphatase